MGLQEIKKLLHKKLLDHLEMVSKLKRPLIEWEKIFSSYTSDRGMITKIYRELRKLNSAKIN
jgi:hypothetical protein